MSADPLPLRPRLAHFARLREDPKTGEPILLYPEGLLALNEAAHAIVVRCDGTRTFDEILASLAEEFDAAPEELRDDVLRCLTQLQSRNLLEP